MAEKMAAQGRCSKDRNNRSSDSTAVGIDLGTTYSCVAVQRKNGRVEIIANDQGNRTTPSCVAFTPEERCIGEGAVNQASRYPASTVYDTKRLIGRKWSEEIVQDDIQRWPFLVLPGENDDPIIVVNYKEEEKCFTPEEISSMVLWKMKQAATTFLGRPVEKAVVTVPAYFNNAQRQATKDAGEIAGLQVIQILNEPTAAALAYGCHNKYDFKGIGKKKILVFDLGGGTFDVSLLEVDEHGVFEVKATNGDTHLGGQDFDNRMVDHLVKTFDEKYHKNVRSNHRSMSRLKKECEKAKRVLSTQLRTEIHIDSFFAGIDFTIKFSRAKFEELNDDLFRKCLGPLEECLKVANVQKSEVDKVVLVGGSTRIPKVQEMLKEFFGRSELNHQINPDEAVAYGAAIHAAQMSEAADDVILVDVTPLSLGVDNASGEVDVVIPRCSRIPCSFSQIRGTSRDEQTRASFAIYEGERPRTADNHLLGEFELSGLRTARKGGVQFLVLFEIDRDGILHVSAKNMDDGKESSITITSDRRTLDKEVISKMIRTAKRFEAEDEDRARERNAMHRLTTLITEIEKSIDASKKPSKSKKETPCKIKDEVNKVKEWLEKNIGVSYHELEYRENALQKVYQQISGASG